MEYSRIYLRIIKAKRREKMNEGNERLNEQLFNVVADEKVSDEAKLKKLKYLVRLGADVNARLYGKSVLSKAIENEAGVEVVQFLREKGANEWIISKEEALEVSQGFWDEKGKIKSLEEIKELLKKGADMEAKNRYGRTVLMTAAEWGHLDVVKYLIENGADLEAIDRDRQTALFCAAKNETLEVCQYLIEQGADVKAKDNCGETALFGAAIIGRLEVCQYLIEQGADVNVKNNNGRTALMDAVGFGNLEVCQYLIEQGADLDAKDKDGETVQDYAKKWGRGGNCLKFLEEYQKKDTVLSKANDKGGFWQRMFGGRD